MDDRRRAAAEALAGSRREDSAGQFLGRRNHLRGRKPGVGPHGARGRCVCNCRRIRCTRNLRAAVPAAPVNRSGMPWVVQPHSNPTRPSLMSATRRWLVTFAALLLAPAAGADTDHDYFRHVIFDNSQQPGAYWYSHAVAVPPSSLERSGERGDRVPVDSALFHSPPNALRLAWVSHAGGGWEAEIRLLGFRNRYPEMSGQTLSLWLYSAEAIAADDLPQVLLSDAREG